MTVNCVEPVRRAGTSGPRGRGGGLSAGAASRRPGRKSSAGGHAGPGPDRCERQAGCMREDSGRNVVVGIDGSEHSIAALDLAAAEAEARGLPLRIVHAYLWPVISRPYAPAARGRQVVRNAMVRVLRARPWLSVDSRVTGHGPAYALIGESRTADL